MAKAWHQHAKRAPKEARTLDGATFDSKSEMRRYAELQLEEKAGLIRNLKRQVRYELHVNGEPIRIRSKGFPNGRACHYTADFVYFRDNEIVVEEHKGHDDPAARLRRAVVEAIYKFRITITGPAA